MGAKAKGRPRGKAAALNHRHDPSSEFEFMVKLDRSAMPDCRIGRMLGCRIGQDGIINTIHTDGLIPKWNADSCDQLVRVGDHIVEVNGVRGDWSEINPELRAAKLLK